MTERRRLKKELATWMSYRKKLPMLIDCSRVYGDYTYSDADLAIADAHIERLRALLAPATSTKTNQQPNAREGKR